MIIYRVKMGSKNLTVLKSLNLLYIEDETNIRENLTTTLNLMCNTTFACANAKEALEIFRKEQVDIVLSDISMPYMSGLELAKKIREEDKSIPIILLSAHTDTPYLLEATRLKLIDYITKPVDFSNLKDALLRATDEIIESGHFNILFENNITYNVAKKILMEKNKEQHITGKEIALLEFLYKNKSKVVTTQQIKNALWEDEYCATDAALKAVLNKLRNKIGKQSIKNVSGIGYQLFTVN